MLSVLLLAVAAAASPFSEWATKFNRSYDSVEEYELRQFVWKTNLDKVEKHNAANHSWTMEMNKFADLTSDEFAVQYITGGYKNFATLRRGFSSSAFRLSNEALPSSVDWTTKGAVTPIKNQGQCGSCWSFSTTGSVEGAHFLANGTLVSLSEQQLMDCSSSFGNQGCNGGLMDSAFQYIISNGGITSEANYPYTAADGTCNQKKSKEIVASIKSFTDVPVNSDDALMAAIAQQPVSVAVEADQSSFQLYAGGVLTATCGTALDHGVLAVGYGTTGGEDYYKVKNSWGADWGMNGYILLGRGPNYNGGQGQCGILMDPSYPTA
jgi:C1A family cysteine protease